MVREMPAKWGRFCQKWIDDPRAKGYVKYIVNSERNINRLNRTLSVLGTGRTKGMSLLDISTGFGMFPYLFMSQWGGGRVVLTDVIDKQNTICKEARDALGLPDAIKFCYANNGYSPLPESIGVFNIITAFSVVPHSFWTKDQWGMFIENSLGHMAPQGIVIIRPNDSCGYDNLKELLKTPKIIEDCVWIEK